MAMTVSVRKSWPASDLALAASAYALIALPHFLVNERSLDGAVWSGVLALLLIGVCAIDIREYRIPDALTIPLGVLGLIKAWFEEPSNLAWAAISGLGGFALAYAVRESYARLRKQSGLGLGDVKLIAAGAAWVGAEGIPGVLLWSSGSALVAVGLARLTGKSVAVNERIPFGPFLGFGIWLVWIYGTL